MKHLYLLRHAKSSWSDPALADEERPLARRGRKAAKKMAKELRRREIRPELVLCSSSRRTRETLELIGPSLGDPTIELEQAIYEAGSDELLTRVRMASESVRSVLLLGHNPRCTIWRGGSPPAPASFLGSFRRGAGGVRA